MEIEQHRRSREGAWIEILIWVLKTWISKVAPVRERGLKWQLRVVNIDKPAVAPGGGRGLKYPPNKGGDAGRQSRPGGGGG